MASQPALPCALATLRRATRVLTRAYESEFRGQGVKATQFTLLMALAAQPGITQGALGEVLALDSTTLTRTLVPLARRGLVRAVPGADRRERRWRLTPKGEQAYDRGRSAWQQVQDRLREALGEDGWRDLFDTANRVAAIG
jgi:DNA-binding MarR family transcriptional regulator